MNKTTFEFTATCTYATMSNHTNPNTATQFAPTTHFSTNHAAFKVSP